jgi:hypothetical protein
MGKVGVIIGCCLVLVVIVIIATVTALSGATASLQNNTTGTVQWRYAHTGSGSTHSPLQAALVLTFPKELSFKGTAKYTWTAVLVPPGRGLAKSRVQSPSTVSVPFDSSTSRTLSIPGPTAVPNSRLQHIGVDVTFGSSTLNVGLSDSVAQVL